MMAQRRPVGKPGIDDYHPLLDGRADEAEALAEVHSQLLGQPNVISTEMYDCKTCVGIRFVQIEQVGRALETNRGLNQLVAGIETERRK
jgi:hypothetical protein